MSFCKAYHGQRYVIDLPQRQRILLRRIDLKHVSRIGRKLACTMAAPGEQSKGPSVFGDQQKNTTLPFTSRRSPVVSARGMVACSQPLAAEVCLYIIWSGQTFEPDRNLICPHACISVQSTFLIIM
jgi:hypothetical protein